MRGRYLITPGAFALTALSTPGLAQVWSLPEPTATPTTSTIEGPVDPQDPLTRPRSVVTPTPSASPAPSPAPTQSNTASTPSPTPRATPSASPSTATRPVPAAQATPPRETAARQTSPARPEPTPSASPTPRVAASPSVQASATPSATTPPDTAANEASPTPSTPPSKAQPSEEPQSTFLAGAWPWLAAGGGTLVLLLLGGALLRRRKSSRADLPHATAREAVEPHPPAPQPAAKGQPVPKAPNAASAPASAPLPAASSRPTAHGEIGFEAVSARLSLVYATLRFRFSIRAITAIPPTNLHGDLTSAHGTRSADEQLRPDFATLPKIGAIPRLKEGEQVVLEGDLQLPLNAIRAVREGDAAFFVPLVRLALMGDESHPDFTPDLPHLELGLVFTVGQLGAETDRQGALAPLRLDVGPQDFPRLDCREVEAGRRKSLLPLDSPAQAV